MAWKRLIILLLFLVLFSLFILGVKNNKFFVSQKKAEHPIEEQKDDKERILKNLSLEQKIGQLFIFGIEGESLTPEIEKFFQTTHPGGIILFSRNIKNENQLKSLIEDLQKLSLRENGILLFIAIDQEGGSVRRIFWLDDKIAQSEIKDEEEAFKVGFERGRALKNLGINLNLAPVLDFTQKGDFLHSRSFQKEPEIAGELAFWMILGQKEAKILTAIKHFPGYVGISFNPETIKVPVVNKIPEILQFQKAIKAKPEFVMTANVIYKDLDENLPCSLSKKCIQFLKEKLEGDYLIISDALMSNALTKTLSSKEQIVLAKKAGVDVLLIGDVEKSYQDQIEAFNALLEAVKSNQISESEIDNSVLKIIKLKEIFFNQKF